MPVKKYDRKDRKNPFGVKWGHWKNPKFKFFISEYDRDEFMDGLIRKEKEEGYAALKISTYEAQMFRRCIELVGSPERVVALCEKEAGTFQLLSKSTIDAVKEYLDEKLNTNKDSNYVRSIRKIIDRFITAIPKNYVSEYTKADARSWMLSLKFAPVTVVDHKKVMIAFFNWCIKQEYVTENVFRYAPAPDAILPEPEFLDICQFKKVMGAAIDYYPDAVAYIALQSFAGLRASACPRLDLKYIKFEQKGILIRSDMAKNKRRIYLDGYPEILWQWLHFSIKIAPEGYSMTKRLYDRRKEQIARITGFTMPRNALRHSFCTYHSAMEGNAYKTCTLLTHRGSPDQFYEH